MGHRNKKRKGSAPKGKNIDPHWMATTLEKAVKQYHADQLSNAEKNCQRVLKKDPANVDALHIYGMICHKRGRFPKAEGLLKRVITLRETIPPYHNSLGNIYQAQGRMEDALSCYTRAVDLDPGFAKPTTISERYSNRRAI